MSKDKDIFEWTDELVLRFAIKWLNDRVGWAIMHDFGVAPSPIQVELEKFKQSKSSSILTPKKILFWTEDKMPILEGDEYWFVAVNSTFKDVLKNVATVAGGSGTDQENYIYFSTKEAAEEYIKKQSHTPKQQSKEWEVVEYADRNDIVIKCYVQPSEFDFTKANFKIHSVKRVIDGEVFSVGDEITTIGYPEHIYKITSFEISENYHLGLKVVRDKEFGIAISEIKKSKPQYTAPEELTINGIKYIKVP